jgi:DNA-binding transcriptional LysR family regulator
MKNLRALLPAPSALFAFEAAARLTSFTRAAAELKITQAAVSYSVKQLEAALGQKLFIRQHRRVTLTEAGERFFQDVSVGLGHIRRSAESLMQGGKPGHVTLSCSTAFASWWMLPRLARFRAAYPEIDLRLQTTDRDVDLAEERIDLGIRRGRGDWPEYATVFLTSEAIYPICSPAYLAGAVRPAGPAELAQAKLVHLDEPFRPRPVWADWFAAQGVAYVDFGEGLRLNDYALVIQAALEGQGVALGWRHLTEDLVARGALVRVLPQPLATGLGFYMAWPKSAALTSDAQRVRDWLAGEFAAAEGQGAAVSAPPSEPLPAGPRVRVSRRP